MLLRRLDIEAESHTYRSEGEGFLLSLPYPYGDAFAPAIGSLWVVSKQVVLVCQYFVASHACLGRCVWKVVVGLQSFQFLVCWVTLDSSCVIEKVPCVGWWCRILPTKQVPWIKVGERWGNLRREDVDECHSFCSQFCTCTAASVAKSCKNDWEEARNKKLELECMWQNEERQSNILG